MSLRQLAKKIDLDRQQHAREPGRRVCLVHSVDTPPIRGRFLSHGCCAFLYMPLVSLHTKPVPHHGANDENDERTSSLVAAIQERRK
jgi:hypothetical protein